MKVLETDSFLAAAERPKNVCFKKSPRKKALLRRRHANKKSEKVLETDNVLAAAEGVNNRWLDAKRRMERRFSAGGLQTQK